MVLNKSLGAQVSFTASADAKQVPLGEVFEVKFTLKNGNGTNFRSPAFGDFNVVGGPNRMNSMTTVNGVSSSSETYSYVLQGKKEGTFSIGAASISVKGQNWATTPLSISVVKGKAQTFSDVKGAKDDVFIRAEVNTHEARLGQQIVLDYKLYTRVNVNGLNRVSESDYNGFFKLEINDYPHGDNRVTIGGKVYLSRILQRIALFPTREGEVVIEPMNLTVGIVKGYENDNPWGGPFFNTAITNNKTVASNSVNIYVKPLPINAPPSFSGAVGDFKVEFNLSKTEGTTDDVVSLKMKVVGNGDAKRWQAPKLQAIEGLDIYEPKTIKEESVEAQGEWQTVKEFEYLIVPKTAGNFTIKPEFSYFPTEGGNFKTFNETYNIKIAQGSNKAAQIAADKIQDIRGIKTATVFTTGINTFFGSMWFWGLIVLPFLILLAVVFYKQWQLKLAQRDVSEVKRENASKVAEQRLARAHEFLQKGNNRLFYDEITKTLFNYVSDKFGMPLSEFTKSNIQERLTMLKINEIHIQQFLKILNDCEFALFAGSNKEGATQQICNDAAQVIVHIENDLK
jgi:hypothetical protein